MEQTPTQESNPALTVFAILGFIALLIAGLWSTIQLIKQGSQLLAGTGRRGVSSFMGLSNAGVAIKVGSKNVAANQPFTLAWSVAKADDGSLTLTYACREGLYLQVDTVQGSYAIPCNAPYAIAADASTLSLTPVSSTAERIELPVTLAVTHGTDAAKTVKDVVTLTINPADASAVKDEVAAVVVPKKEVTAPIIKPVVSKPIAPKVVATKLVPVQKSDEAGKPDLRATIAKIGVIQNGTFVEKAIFATTDTVTVKFDVTNLGTKAAERWTFSASLPSSPVFLYNSDAQETLYAGATAHLTMSFDKLASGTGIMTIDVDAAQRIAEVVESNNGASRQIVVQ